MTQIAPDRGLTFLYKLQSKVLSGNKKCTPCFELFLISVHLQIYESWNKIALSQRESSASNSD